MGIYCDILLGLNFQIRPFRKAHMNRDTDKELYYLGRYLRDIAALDDFSVLDHKKWERYDHHVCLFYILCYRLRVHPAITDNDNMAF